MLLLKSVCNMFFCTIQATKLQCLYNARLPLLSSHKVVSFRDVISCWGHFYKKKKSQKKAGKMQRISFIATSLIMHLPLHISSTQPKILLKWIMAYSIYKNSFCLTLVWLTHLLPYQPPWLITFLAKFPREDASDMR